MSVSTLVIGSGVAATALVTRLLKKNPLASILMLEAGNKVKTKDFALWQNYLVERRLPYDHCYDLDYPDQRHPERDGENAYMGDTPVKLAGSRLFVYGGSTMAWGGWSLRMKPEDFELNARTRFGADWPMSYADLDKYYWEAEHYLAVSGDSSDTSVPRSGRQYPFREFPFTLQDQPVADAMDTLGIGYGSMPIARRGVSTSPSRHAPCQTTGTCEYCPFGARYVASNYLDDLRNWNDYPNFEVRCGTVVETITTSSRRTAASVKYTEQENGRITTNEIEAERIIVAAGAIESAKLLQRSRTADWPDGIGNDSGHVGANFIMHPLVTFYSPPAPNSRLLQPEMDFPTLISRHFDSPDEQAFGKYVIINPPSTVRVDLAQKMLSGKAREKIERDVRGNLSRSLWVAIEVFGTKTNTIGNWWDHRNRLGMIETSVRYCNDTFRPRIRTIAEVISRLFAEMGTRVDAETLVHDHMNPSWAAHHAASTCRMSRDPATGVVDSDLRVHGMENLYICSNAVFPSLGAVNPTLTLTALALRLGDHLNDNSVAGDA